MPFSKLFTITLKVWLSLLIINVVIFGLSSIVYIAYTKVSAYIIERNEEANREPRRIQDSIRIADSVAASCATEGLDTTIVPRSKNY